MSYIKNLEGTGRLNETFTQEDVSIKSFKATFNQTSADVWFKDVFLKRVTLSGELCSDVFLSIVTNQFFLEVRQDAANRGLVIDMTEAERLYPMNDPKVIPITTDDLKDAALHIKMGRLNDMVDLEQSLSVHLQEEGFVRGAIVSFEQGGYGIFTGEFNEQGEDGVSLNFTCRRTMNSVYCTLVTDVNKDILRMVRAEQQRIIEDATNFVELIDESIEEIVYGKD